MKNPPSFSAFQEGFYGPQYQSTKAALRSSSTRTDVLPESVTNIFYHLDQCNLSPVLSSKARMA